MQYPAYQTQTIAKFSLILHLTKLEFHSTPTICLTKKMTINYIKRKRCELVHKKLPLLMREEIGIGREAAERREGGWAAAIVRPSAIKGRLVRRTPKQRKTQSAIFTF